MLRPRLLVVLLVGGGCTPFEEPSGSVEPRVVTDAEADSPTRPQTGATLTFRRVRFEEASMELDVVDAPYDTHAWDVGGVLSQTVALTDELALRILVRAGPGESLASLRRDHEGDDVKLSRVRRDRVCGRVSRRQEIGEPEVFIECIEYADGRPSEPGYIPATNIVAHEFRHADLDVVVTWEVATELRAQYRDDEARFFDALRCLPAASTMAR